MDGLESFSNDPILDINDGISESSSFNEEPLRRNILEQNGSAAPATVDNDEILKEVFGDDYFDEKKGPSTEISNDENQSLWENSSQTTRTANGFGNENSQQQNEAHHQQQPQNQQFHQGAQPQYFCTSTPAQNFQEENHAHHSASQQISSTYFNHAHEGFSPGSSAVESDPNIIAQHAMQQRTNSRSWQHQQQQQQQQGYHQNQASSADVGQQQIQKNTNEQYEQQMMSPNGMQHVNVPLAQSSGMTDIGHQRLMSTPLQTQSSHIGDISILPRNTESNPDTRNVPNQAIGVMSQLRGISPQPPVQVPSAAATISQSNAPVELSDEDDHGADVSCSTMQPAKRQRLDDAHNYQQNHVTPGMSPASASNAARTGQMPDWMKDQERLQQLQRLQQQHQKAQQIRPGMTIKGYQPPAQVVARSIDKTIPQGLKTSQHPPSFIEIERDFVSTWDYPLPSEAYKKPLGRRKYELSLVNVKEFTITGLSVGYSDRPSSLAGLRKKIKELSKDHGKATYERNKDGPDGRWRIPLGAYRSFYQYLISDSMCQVIGIPENQLKIASLGKARLEKGYPSVKKLITLGVPRGLATALAPFQRGGVDFVVEKEGRALIADEMGLGKTVQAIASMSVYHGDWPILVLTPSSARYHWENEFQHWLGRDSAINTQKQERVKLGGESDGEEEEEDDGEIDESNCMPLLDDSQMHVLTSGKDVIIPNERTKVVICSYGLAPALVRDKKIFPGLFRAAIVDESHMLKNMNTKRTKNLVPVLHATNRCVLLSGTPALAKPTELWPQLKILSTERTGWWENESDFLDNYVKTTSTVRRAELHAMLTGTVMIRRLKHDILKSLPRKMRGKALVDVCTSSMRKEFHQCMALLREGKGQIGKLARQHSALSPVQESTADFNMTLVKEPDALKDANSQNKFEEAKLTLQAESKRRYNDGVRSIDYNLSTHPTQLNDIESADWRTGRLNELQNEVQIWYQERIHELQEEEPQEPEITRKSVLNRMYSLTGKAKLALISDMLQKWLRDPTKGKICVFAHHIFMLDELVSRAGLSKAAGSSTQYIRIDGSTSPKERQAQIKKFQTDPMVRIAILGITAAGVAVTLTAASTVWFTELFWTPALMIQAEDRCHRIGQNARVNCLYFVATGTLDELLWKLLEKKFRDLGEFVEGMEKQKMVVHKTYHGTQDLHSMFEIPDGDESAGEVNFDEEDSEEDEEGKELLKLEHDLEGDIDLLASEELTMMKTDGDEDDVDDSKAEDLTAQGGKAEQVAGSTEDEAIMLSDCEEGPPPPNMTSGTEAASTGTKFAPPETAKGKIKADVLNNNEMLDPRKPLVGCRGYSIVFEGPSFGIQLFMHHGRAVVGRRLDPKYERPAVGDTLIAVDGQRLPQTPDINQITAYLKACIARKPVDLIFIEVPVLKRFVMRKTEEEGKKQEELKAKMAKSISNGPGDVIELLDDD